MGKLLTRRHRTRLTQLVVMGGRCQDEWVHSVPKAPGTPGARISVNFQSTEQAQRPRPDRRHIPTSP